MSLKNPEKLESVPSESPKNILELSRKALAEKLKIDESELPDGKFFRLVDAELDKLAGLDPAKKAAGLKEHLKKIDLQETMDKARELSENWKSVLQWEALTQSTSAITAVTETLKTQWLAHGAEAAVAIWAIAWAKNIDDATKGVDMLSKIVDWVWKTFSSALDGIKNIFSSFFKMIGLDKLFKSIGWFFGINKSPEEQKKLESTTPINIPETPTTDKVKDVVKKWETPEWRKEFVDKASKSLWDKISQTYFWWEKLSEAQLKKIYGILDSSLNTESIKKIADRLDKGEINIGEMMDGILDVGGTYPARVMWELSLSGIIPFWAITQHVVVNPAWNLINLTFDWLGFPMTSLSLENFWSLLDEKAKNGDSHALDMARIQLYGVNSVLFRTIGTALGWVAASGIMLANTTTWVDWLKHLWKMSYLKDYDSVAKEFWNIENILGRGSGYADKLWAFQHMLLGIKDLRANSLIMDAVTKNTINSKLNYQWIVDTIHDAIRHNPWILDHINTAALTANLKNENGFREALKNLIKWPSSNAWILDAMQREMAKYGGGRTGEALKYMEQIDSVKKWQQSLVGDVWMMSEKLKRLALSYESLKIARSGDTVVLHMENMDDISKFRAFLSTIPGGIRALSEVIPASSLVVSLGSVAWDAREKKDGITGDSIMDVFKTALIPAYGTWWIIRDKTVDFGKMIEKGELPEFSDLALTGVVGGVFVYEVTRVWSGLIDMKNGNLVKWASKLTYMHDIGRGIGQISRWARNVYTLATKPVLHAEFAKWIANFASKMPKKWRIAIGGVALAWLATGVTYAMWSDSPEELQKKLQKDGYIDANNNPTHQTRDKFHSKDPKEKKDILDTLLAIHLQTNKDLPRTHYDEKWGKYSIILDTLTPWKSFSDSPFRTTLQSIGVDIDIQTSEV